MDEVSAIRQELGTRKRGSEVGTRIGTDALAAARAVGMWSGATTSGSGAADGDGGGASGKLTAWQRATAKFAPFEQGASASGKLPGGIGSGKLSSGKLESSKLLPSGKRQPLLGEGGEPPADAASGAPAPLPPLKKVSEGEEKSSSESLGDGSQSKSRHRWERRAHTAMHSGGASRAGYSQGVGGAMGVAMAGVADTLADSALGTAFSLAVQHLQVLAMLPLAVHVPWPAALLDLARGLQWLFLEWPALTVTLQCARPLLYYDKLRGMMIVVPSLLAGVLLHFWLLTLCCCGALSREKLLRFRCRTVSLYLVLVVLLYAPVSATILRFFTCRDIGGTSYLTAEPLVRCDSELHRGWAPTAWVGVVLWVAGLPCLAVLAIAKLAWQRRLHHGYTLRAWGLVYRKYTLANCCWEGLEMVQKLAFTSLILLLEEHVAAQLSLFLVLSLFFIVLHANRRPYRDAAAGLVALLAQLSIFFMLLSALLHAAGAELPDGLVVAVAIAPLVAMAAIIVRAVAVACCGRCRPAHVREARAQGRVEEMSRRARESQAATPRREAV